ncbi:MAG: MBL fold metallo-hydrolase [Pirellulaceae bacterium]|jgi:pyrroloquinoline quinone biosynthesis protein B|nr:MBL fold metallo-hydrolase [Pirellulaceae bacterium]
MQFIYSVGLLAFVALATGCNPNSSGDSPKMPLPLGTVDSPEFPVESRSSAPYVVVLGVAQDAGYPQAGCQRDCCRRVWRDPSLRGYAACLAIIDPVSQQRWMLECTPDFREQLQLLDRLAPVKSESGTSDLNGILLTHAHIGHYSGLIHLGHEAMGASGIPVYAMPRMIEFLRTSGPWSQLVAFRNIELRSLADQQTIVLNDRIRITPLLVPHRDEFSETVGFRIEGPQHSVLFLPDIDKWDRWNVRVEDVLGTVDRAYVDGTFFADGELPHRSMDQIPHPFIVESIARFAPLSTSECDKIRFLHFNHTNPAHDPNSDAVRTIRAAGHDIARRGEMFSL